MIGLAPSDTRLLRNIDNMSGGSTDVARRAAPRCPEGRFHQRRRRRRCCTHKNRRGWSGSRRRSISPSITASKMMILGRAAASSLLSRQRMSFQRCCMCTACRDRATLAHHVALPVTTHEETRLRFLPTLIHLQRIKHARAPLGQFSHSSASYY